MFVPKQYIALIKNIVFSTLHYVMVNLLNSNLGVLFVYGRGTKKAPVLIKKWMVMSMRNAPQVI